MGRFKSLFALVCLLCVAVPVAWGAQKKYTSGKFLDVQVKSRQKVDMVLVNNPMTTEVPYYEITFELAGVDYVAEYTPRHQDEELPDNFHVGEEVKGRVEKHHLFLMRPEGGEMQWLITKHKPISNEKPQQ